MLCTEYHRNTNLPLQGNYPYRSSYILNGIGTLPPFPMRVACEFMAEKEPSEEALLSGLSKAAGVFYNYTGDVPCFNYRYLTGILLCLFGP